MIACRQSRRQSGFTLIELLVVVAIIALLISILLPSLNQARNQARLLVCKANLKQVSVPIALYQNDYNGKVPIMFNYFASGSRQAPARACWLSVAMRDYFESLVTLENLESEATGLRFDPDTNWNNVMRQEYEEKILPEFFVCPYARREAGQPEIFVEDQGRFRITKSEGRQEYYQTFMWETIIRGFYPGDRPWPGEATGNLDAKGKPKYSALSWNYIRLKPNLQMNPLSTELTSKLHRQWGNGDLVRTYKNQEIRVAGSLAEFTTVFCARGEHNINAGGGAPGTSRFWGRKNIDSHKVGQEGGTSVLMGDGHIEWIEGTRVGWP